MLRVCTGVRPTPNEISMLGCGYSLHPVMSCAHLRWKTPPESFVGQEGPDARQAPAMERTVILGGRFGSTSAGVTSSLSGHMQIM